MVVWWGLDLKEIQWSKFKSSYMWNNAYHLRKTKFVVYQLAMILCVVSESLGTAALSDYVDQQSEIARLGNPEIYEYNDDYIGIASFNIFSGIFVAFIFGAAFFFDLIWPERREDKGIRIAWKVCSVMTNFTTLASAIAMTIIVARRSAIIYGPADQAAGIEQGLLAEGRYPLSYRHNTRAVASLAFIWPGLLACIASTIVMWYSINYTAKFGPWSKHEREARGLGTSVSTNGNQAQVEKTFEDWNDEKLKDPKRGGGPTGDATDKPQPESSPSSSPPDGSERPDGPDRLYTGV